MVALLKQQNRSPASGGYLSDRLPAPQLVLSFSLALAVCTCWSTPLVAALLTVLSKVSTASRGAVLGLNITFACLDWIGAIMLGGVMPGFAGFAGLAILAGAFGLLGAELAPATWLLPRKRAHLLVARDERQAG